MSEKADERMLRAALLWLRNHYDVSIRARPPRGPAGRHIDAKVLEVIDAIIDEETPSLADIKAFRERYMGWVQSLPEMRKFLREVTPAKRGAKEDDT
jgi:hypothetical protein